MARSSSYVYDGATQKWTQSAPSTTTSSPSDGVRNLENNTWKKSSDSGSGGSGGSSNLVASNPDKDTSSGAVEKEYNTIEFNTLSGSLNFIANNKTIQLKAGDTVIISGIGKYLSGAYYVKELTRQIGTDGYSHSATLIRTDFGSSLKSSNTSSSNAKEVSSSPSSKDAKRTYTVKKGDCLWNISKQYYGEGQQYKTIYDANTNQIVDPNLIYPGQELVIP